MTMPSQTMATIRNESWSMDLMADQLFESRKFRPFTLVDDFSRESMTIDLDQRLVTERAAAILN